jgi:hypothetical protein
MKTKKRVTIVQYEKEINELKQMVNEYRKVMQRLAKEVTGTPDQLIVLLLALDEIEAELTREIGELNG